MVCPVWWWWNAIPSFFLVDLRIFDLYFFLHQFSCSLHLFLKVPVVWPTYFFGQSFHGIEYIMFFLSCFSMLLPFFNSIAERHLTEKFRPKMCNSKLQGISKPNCKVTQTLRNVTRELLWTVKIVQFVRLLNKIQCQSHYAFPLMCLFFQNY